MNVLIVSIDHKFQFVKGMLAMPLDGARDKLEALLKGELDKRHVTFIAEEAAYNSNRPTIAQKLACSHEPPIQWQNIDMTEAERKVAGIYDALDNRPYRRESRRMEVVTIEYRIPEDNVREEFMVSKTVECAAGAESILVICGDMHTRPLKQKFESRGHSADTDESLIAERNWVEAGVAPIDRGDQRS